MSSTNGFTGPKERVVDVSKINQKNAPREILGPHEATSAHRLSRPTGPEVAVKIDTVAPSQDGEDGQALHTAASRSLCWRAA